jgi:hypothetical protein
VSELPDLRELRAGASGQPTVRDPPGSWPSCAGSAAK